MVTLEHPGGFCSISSQDSHFETQMSLLVFSKCDGLRNVAALGLFFQLECESVTVDNKCS